MVFLALNWMADSVPEDEREEMDDSYDRMGSREYELGAYGLKL